MSAAPAQAEPSFARSIERAVELTRLERRLAGREEARADAERLRAGQRADRERVAHLTAAQIHQRAAELHRQAAALHDRHHVRLTSWQRRNGDR